MHDIVRHYTLVQVEAMPGGLRAMQRTVVGPLCAALAAADASTTKSEQRITLCEQPTHLQARFSQLLEDCVEVCGGALPAKPCEDGFALRGVEPRLRCAGDQIKQPVQALR